MVATVSDKEKQRVNSFEVRCWTDIITNEEILKGTGKGVYLFIFFEEFSYQKGQAY